MTRIMMMPPDAEVTGMHIDANGHFFVNAMHPDEANYKATVGVINGVDWNNLAETVPEPKSRTLGWCVRLFLLVEAEVKVDFRVAIWSAILHGVSNSSPR
jgi:hypothetical protein